MTTLIEKLRDLLKEIETFVKGKERAIALPNIYSLVYSVLDQMSMQDGLFRGLVDVYLDAGAMFAVLAIDGLLYKADVTLTDAGVVLGTPTQVVIDYKPVAQSIKTTRQADGKYRWFAFPAATAVLNRSGELDSRQLFESFVKRIESGEAPYPFLSFYHVGEKITLGQADYAAVDGYAYLVSGLWGDDPLAQATRKAIEKDPGYYGISIGYFYQPETKERLEAGNGITIPVYTDGINHEVSILAEKDAACLYTGAYTEGVNRMNKKTKAELLKIAGEDPVVVALVGDLEKQVDTINQDIEDKNLIRRENEPKHVEPAPPNALPGVEAPTPPPGGEPPELQLTEEAMTTLAERVAEKVTAEHQKSVDTLANDVSKHVQALTEQIANLTARVADLEKPLAETVEQAIKDMPRNITNTLTVGYRPRQQKAEQPEPLDLDAIAGETLANLK